MTKIPREEEAQENDIKPRTIRTFFDPLQLPIWSQSLLTDMMFSAHLSNYVTLEKCTETVILTPDGKFLEFPLDKQQLLKDTYLLPLEKRHILKMMQTLEHITMKYQPGFLIDCSISHSTQVLTEFEEVILSEKPMFQQLINNHFRNIPNEHIALLCLLFDCRPDSEFDTYLFKFGQYQASKQKFDDCGTHVVCQYGITDIIQAFERLIYVYSGFTSQDDVTEVDLDKKQTNSEHIQKISFEHALIVSQPKLKQRYVQIAIDSYPAQLAELLPGRQRNLLVVSDQFTLIAKKGGSNCISGGVMQLDFIFATDSEGAESVCRKFVTEQLGVPAE